MNDDNRPGHAELQRPGVTPGGRHRAPRRLCLAVLLALASLLALCTLVPGQATASAAACRHIAGPFRSSHAAIYGAGGQQYIPYGINVIGLAHRLQPVMPSYTATVNGDDAVIAAAASSWCANTVRLQIEQDYLVAADGKVNRPFLAAVQAEVSYAESLGLVVVLNCQTQMTPAHSVEFMPTRRTLAFWDSLASHYRTDPQVVFDVFNEPLHLGGDTGAAWRYWHGGGVIGGVRFFGMQQLADRLRGHDGARNLLWVEGLSVGGSLRRAWDFRVAGDGPLAYAIHRPAGPHTARTWYTLFGYLAAHNLAPVVEGEWADYARTDAPWACWGDAPRSVPAWLRYLANHRIGMAATKMVPGQLIESPAMNDPTHFRADWKCRTGLNEGAGSQIMRWFALHNS